MSARDDDDDMQLRGRNRVNKKNVRCVWKISDQNMNKWTMKKKNGTTALTVKIYLKNSTQKIIHIIP